MMTVREKVWEILTDVLSVPPHQETSDELSFQDDLDADSIDMVAVVGALEENFGILIPDANAEKFSKVGDVLRYLKEEHGFNPDHEMLSQI
ncbi:MAG: acyl carrier protein [bacterium]